MKAEKKENDTLEHPADDEPQAELSLLLSAEQAEDDLKLVSLYGDVDEEKCLEVIQAMRILAAMRKEEGEEKLEFEFLISTMGGSASDMFAIYDTMRMVKEECEVVTRGVGKVMSAGVLLLAAGTKDKRLIGKNCRLMLHSVVSGHIGELHNLENELEEVQWTQSQYVKALADETNMTEKYIKNLLNRKVNVYLTAEEAVEYGIADEVF